jgi:pyruvate dehydrogenase E1 component alpha subunit
MVDMLTKMLKSRWWEEGIKEQFLAGTDGLYGSFHISVGQEACPVGACAALRDDDFITSTHRGHHDLIAKGGDIRKMAAEIYFKEGGYNRAYGGSMHITDVSKGILGMNGIIGPSYLLAAGAAYGAKVRGTDQVAIAMGGDGSVQNGWFWAGLRNAALYKLPLILFIQNNGWQVSNPTENTISIRDLAQIGKGLDVPGEVVDGQDVLGVHTVTKRAVERARAGEGPTIIEAKTYRFYDHSGFAGAQEGVLGAFGLPYRSDKDVRTWIANDPITRFRSQLIALEVLTEESADELLADVQQQVQESIEYARNSPEPQPDAALAHVYAEGKVAPAQIGFA